MEEKNRNPGLAASQMAVDRILKSVGTGEFYIMRRSFGQEFANATTETYLAYVSMEDIPDDMPYRRQFQKACFLVAGLICNNENPSKPVHRSGTRSFESMLHERYMKETPSGQARLKTLLMTSFTKWSGFETMFASIFRYIQNKQNTTNLDYVKLLNDLRFWNASNQSVRKEWARVMILGERRPRPAGEAENTGQQENTAEGTEAT